MPESSPKQIIDEEKGNKIAWIWPRGMEHIRHDLAGFASSIRIDNNWLEKAMPDLLKGYQLAVQHQLLEPSIEEKVLQAIGNAPTDLRNTLEKLFEYLQAIGSYRQSLIAPQTPPPFYVCALIETLLTQYPWESPEQRKCVQVNTASDFQVQCETSLIQALLWNFLEITLSQIALKKQGEIHIWAEEEAEYFVLHFKDTLGTTADRTLAQSFDACFLRRNGKMQLGLGFCQLQCLYLGGDIVYEIEKGKYTQIRRCISNSL